MKQEIKNTNAEFQSAFLAGDTKRLAAVYTEDGQALPPNAQTFKGRTDIAGFWQAVLDMGIVEAKLETVELDESQDTAIEIGHYTLKTAGGDVADSGKYIVVWKQENGQWLWHRDIWNSSRAVN